MSSAVLSRPNLLIGGVMMAIGLLLVIPSLWNGLHFRAAPAVLLEAFPQVLDDGRVRLAVLYEYEIRPGDLSGVVGPARALGWERCDRFGRPVDDLVLSDAEAVRFIADVRGPRPLATSVYYRPDRPLETAHAQIAGSMLLFSLPHLGLLLVISPPLTWMVLILLRTRWRTPRS